MMRTARPLAAAAALFVALAGREVGAETCAPEKDAPRVVLQASASGGVDQETADLLLASGFYPAIRARVPDVDWVNPTEVAGVYRLELLRESLGGSADVSRLVERLGSPFVLEIGFGTVGSNRRIVKAGLFDTSSGATLLREQVESGPDEDALLQAVLNLAQTIDPATLRCELLGLRERPAVPRLTLRATPPEGPPGEVIRVRATLIDESTGFAQEGKSVRITQNHGTDTRSSLLYTTNQDGVVNVDLDVGSETGMGSVEATWTGSKGRTTRSNPASVPYRVWEPAGDLVIRAPEAALHVGGAATVTATLQDGGTPVQGAEVTFAATDGTVGTSAATTDADGNAATPFQAPDENAVVDVTATTPAPPGKRPRAGGDLTATLSFVVDAGVTLSLNAPGTVEGGTSAVTADLVVGGRALPAIDVSFSLEGAGALSAASAPTNEAGRAEILWVAPPGNSSATITGEAVVDGLRYKRSVTVNAGAAGGLVVRVIPKAANNAQTAVFLDSGTGCGEVIATPGGMYVCPNGPYDIGTTRDAPVKVRAETAGTHFQIDVTRPSAGEAVVEFSGAPQSVDAEAEVVVELGLPSAGTIDVAVDVSAAPSTLDYSVTRPTDGGTFVLGGSTTRVLRSPESSATIDVPAAGPLQLGFLDYRTPGVRFTLTFRPQ